MSCALAQMDRILANLIKIGRIHSVDFDAGTATVDFDGELVAGLEWSKSRAGADRSWNGGYTKGEQGFGVISIGRFISGCYCICDISRRLSNAGNDKNPKRIFEDGTCY